MKRELRIIEIISNLIVTAIAIMMIVGLLIPLIKNSTDSINGYVIFTKIQALFYNDNYTTVRAVNWMLLIIGFISILAVFLSILRVPESLAHTIQNAIAVLGFLSSCAYMIEGFVLLSYAKNLTTLSPILFAIQFLLMISYLICQQQIKNINSSAQEEKR